MPIYEYRCRKCGEEYELFKSVTDDTDPACKLCKGPVQKLISRSSFHLKGSGWYATDYAKKGSSGSENTKEEPSKPANKESSKEEPSSKEKSPD